jgi:hypothetical protein
LLGQKGLPGLTGVFGESGGRKQPIYLVCDNHNTNGSFLWCPCSTIKEEKEIECEHCKRWFHLNCFKDPEGKKCKGCKDNDIFIKNLKLPELLSCAVKFEKQVQLDKHNIKFLDHFCFPLSLTMSKIIEDKRNSFEV